MNDLQKRLLVIFKAFAEVCEKHNLSYFLNGGSCLGAIRHKGFIPWDDDIDVMHTVPECQTYSCCLVAKLCPTLCDSID